MSNAFGKYELLERLGLGGMAEVFLARTTSVGGFEKQLAIKRLLPQYTEDQQTVDLLADEARITVQLTHPNIVQVYDFGQVDGAYFIAMEFVDGLDLKTLIQIDEERSRPLPVDVALHVAISVLEGLDFAHKRRDDQGEPLGIIHRDVSPHNVLISRQGQIKLTDFGVARARISVHVSVVGDIRGKFSYMPPEQACGGEIDQRVDIFAAGAILYELLCGVQPFRSTSTGEQMKLLTSKVAPPSTLIPELPEGLDAATLRALDPDPEKRYESAQDFATALRDELKTLGKDRMSAQQTLVRLVDERFEASAREADEASATRDPFTPGEPGGDFIFPDQLADQIQAPRTGEIEERPEVIYDDDNLHNGPSVSFSDALLREAALQTAEHKAAPFPPSRHEDRTAVLPLHGSPTSPERPPAAALAYAETALQLLPLEVEPHARRADDGDPTRIRFNPLEEESTFDSLAERDPEDDPTEVGAPLSEINGTSPRAPRDNPHEIQARSPETDREELKTSVQINLPKHAQRDEFFSSPANAPEHLPPDDALLEIGGDRPRRHTGGKPTVEVSYDEQDLPRDPDGHRDDPRPNRRPPRQTPPRGRYAMAHLPSEPRRPEPSKERAKRESPARGSSFHHDHRDEGGVDESFVTAPQAAQPTFETELAEKREGTIPPPPRSHTSSPRQWLGWAMIGAAILIGVVIAVLIATW